MNLHAPQFPLSPKTLFPMRCHRKFTYLKSLKCHSSCCVSRLMDVPSTTDPLITRHYNDLPNKSPSVLFFPLFLIIMIRNLVKSSIHPKGSYQSLYATPRSWWLRQMGTVSLKSFLAEIIYWLSFLKLSGKIIIYITCLRI